MGIRGNYGMWGMLEEGWEHYFRDGIQKVFNLKKCSLLHKIKKISKKK